MKKTFALSMFAIAFVLMSFAPEKENYPTIENGSTMPMMDHVMMDVSGDNVTLADIKGENGTLVIFSCNTCPFVVAWEDRYDDMTQIANRFSIGVVFVNSNEAKRDGDDSIENMKAHAEELRYTAPYVVDASSELANSFGAKTTPHVFLFDSEDALVYQGSLDDNYKDASAVENPYLQNALFAIHQGTDIDPAKTDAKGCSIKRSAE